MTAIARIYLRYIIEGTKTLEDVPTKWRQEVRLALEEIKNNL